MKILGCFLTLSITLLLTDNSNAWLLRNRTNVNVNPAGVHVRTAGPRQNLNVNVNYAHAQPVHAQHYQHNFVNHQVLVHQNFRRAQLANINSFSYTPVNSAANIRFNHSQYVHLHQPPITAAPIIEHHAHTLPPMNVVGPRGVCPPPAPPNANYLQQAPIQQPCVPQGISQPGYLQQAPIQQPCGPQGISQPGYVQQQCAPQAPLQTPNYEAIQPMPQQQNFSQYNQKNINNFVSNNYNESHRNFIHHQAHVQHERGHHKVHHKGFAHNHKH